ncbi:MAG TPA: CDP-alcohol phosphatidyltransferase family protein [Candidatus Bathyarchaeota archaeon]|nr:CDP-alcohol phosphatidyltransferase family protein [Candidatus Bathyarchaeota archaeon]
MEKLGGYEWLLTKLKQRAQLWFASEATMLHKLGLSPNQVSILGIAFAVLSAIAYWQWKLNSLLLVVAPLLMLASGLLDALDGALARLYGETTKFGGFFDSLLDRYADAFILCGIILGGLTEVSWGLAALVGSLLVSYVRARAEAAGVKMESVGLAERAERIVLLALASFLSFVWLEALGWGVLVLAVLTNLTVIQRVIHFRRASQ